jgi:hypothetical protein
VDGLVLRYFLIELIGVFNRAVLHAGRAAGAFVLQDVPRFLYKSYFEVSRFPFYFVNFRVGQNFNVRVPADLDQLGRENSH